MAILEHFAGRGKPVRQGFAKMPGQFAPALAGRSVEAKKAPTSGAFRAKSRVESDGLRNPFRRRPFRPSRHRLACRETFFGASTTIASVVIDETGNGGCILQRCAHHLGRIDDPASFIKSPYAPFWAPYPWEYDAFLDQLADDNRAVVAGIVDDLPGRRLDGSALRTMSMPVF